MAINTGPGALSGLNSKGSVGSPVGSPVGQSIGKADSTHFKQALEQATAAVRPTPTGTASGAAAANELKFSNHAIERMRSRGISFQPDEMKNIAAAIAKASAKGAKDTLVLAGENALIVSVKNQTVVTVMDRQAMKDNVFTNIDSTVVI
jgi:flagellar operon protein